MAEDHGNARRLAEGLATFPQAELDPTTVQTNIVVFRVPDAPGLVDTVADEVELNVVDARTVRAVTHMDVDQDGIDRALAAIGPALSKGS
jgi:threonine aldolase